VAHAINPLIQVIGVQSEASPAAYESWKQNRLVTAPNRTFAEGLATGVAFELPQEIMRDHLHDFLLLTEEEIMRGMLWMIERAHTLAEGAGAAALAGAYRMRDELRGKKVGVICSGGNTSIENLRHDIAQLSHTSKHV